MLDHEDAIFRDIEITRKDTFGTLHNMIQEAYGFDNSQMASFYVSNENWEKGQEITLMDMAASEGGEPIWLMHDTPLHKIVFESGQKLLYVFDFMLMWCFYIDVISINEFEETVILPRIKSSFGEAPEQYSKSPEITFETAQSEPIRPTEDEEDEVNQLFRVMSGHDSADDFDF